MVFRQSEEPRSGRGKHVKALLLPELLGECGHISVAHLARKPVGRPNRFQGEVSVHRVPVDERLIDSGVIRDGMVPKVNAALAAVNQGVPRARIVNLTGLRTAGGTSFFKEETV